MSCHNTEKIHWNLLCSCGKLVKSEQKSFFEVVDCNKINHFARVFERVVKEFAFTFLPFVK